MKQDELTKVGTFCLFVHIRRLLIGCGELRRRGVRTSEYIDMGDSVAEMIGELSRRYMPAIQPILDDLCMGTQDVKTIDDITILYQGVFSSKAKTVAEKNGEGSSQFHCPRLLWQELTVLWTDIRNEYELSVDQNISQYLKKRFMTRAVIDELESHHRNTIITFFYSVTSPEPTPNDDRRVLDALQALHIKLMNYRSFIEWWTDKAILGSLIEQAESDRNYADHYITGLGLTS